MTKGGNATFDLNFDDDEEEEVEGGSAARGGGRSIPRKAWRLVVVVSLAAC